MLVRGTLVRHLALPLRVDESIAILDAIANELPAGTPVSLMRQYTPMAVNYTSKTQFLYRINKGVLGVTQNEELNRHTPHSTRRVPFTNMMYLGDGLTDVPCMSQIYNYFSV